MPDATLLRAMFMEWAYDQAKANPGLGIDAAEFMTANDIDDNLGYSIVRSCANEGWVDDVSTFGGPAVIMKFEGHAYVEAQRKKRNDAGVRSAAARNALLAYYHRRELEGALLPETAQFVFADESYFEGAQFSTSDIERAVKYLSAKGLIKGTENGDGWLKYAEVTPEGQDCIDQFDGDVRRYLSRNEGAIPMVNTTNIGTFNNSGNAAIASTGVTQQVSGPDVASLAEFARVLLAGIDDLGLEGDLKEQVRAALEEMKSEAKAETAPGKLKGALGRVAGFVAKAGQPVLTAAFMLLATHLGLPPSK